MIITKIKVKPFGGLPDAELSLERGLNVVLGPNEAGKSTIFRAIQSSLFTKSSLTKSKLDREIRPYFPVGGDTARVELYVEHDDKNYVLKKTWGTKGDAELLMPAGSVLTDDDAIAKTLGSMLPATEGTCRSVLMVYQNGLIRTVEDLKAKPEAISSVGDMLRAALQETDGVSVDALRHRVGEEYEILFSRWDYENNRPQNPGKRFVKGVGEILGAYYAIEDAEKAFEEARQHEEDIDALNRRMAEQIEMRDREQAFVNDHKKAASDAQDRRVLEAELDAKQQGIQVMQEANSRWPVLEAKEKDLESSLPAIDKRIAELDEEDQAAQREEQAKTLREKFEKAKAEQQVLIERNRELESVQPLPVKELQEIKKVQAKLDKLQAVAAAGELALEFRAKNDLSLTVQTDFTDPVENTIAAGQSRTFAAGARLKIEHIDWEILVKSGEQDAEKLAEKVGAEKSLLKQLMEKHRISDVEEAEKVSAYYENRLQKLKAQQSKLEMILEDQSYEDLEKKVAELGPVPTARARTDVVKELTEKHSEKKAVAGELETVRNSIQKYEKLYGNKEDMVVKLGETSVAARELLNKIENLAQLPEGYENAAAFLDKYAQAEERSKRLDKEVAEIRLEHARLLGKAPEISVEEAENLLANAKEEFQKVLARGNAVARIKEVMETILEETDSNTYAELEKSLSDHVAAMTDNRYKKIAMDESLPDGFIRDDGAKLPYELLSTGTKDVLALALRLTMASYFLDGADGFVVMDDPLVDMDPDRQRKAAETLRSFASDKQVIVFTCHPAHAQLLGEESVRAIEMGSMVEG